MIASCGKMAPSKSAVEAGFEKDPVAVPSVSANASTSKVDLFACSVVVDVTLSGVTSAEGVGAGVIYSEDPNFASSKSVAIESIADGTTSVYLPVSGERTYYFRAYANNSTESVYSEAFSVDVPKIPFYAEVVGSYATSESLIDYFDRKFVFSTKITLVEDSTEQVYIENLFPYISSAGLNHKLIGVLDEDTKTISIPSGQAVGSVAVMLALKEGEDGLVGLKELVLKQTANGGLATMSGFGAQAASGGWYDLMLDQVVFEKQ